MNSQIQETAVQLFNTATVNNSPDCRRRTRTAAVSAMADNLPTNSAGRASVAPRTLSLPRQESERQLWVDEGRSKEQVSKKIFALVSQTHRPVHLAMTAERRIGDSGCAVRYQFPSTISINIRREAGSSSLNGPPP